MENFSRLSFVAVLVMSAAGVTLTAADAPPGATVPPTLGPADAPVTLEMFSDLQCPQCARSEPTVKALKSEFGDKLRVVFRHFPMEKHENAILAACAAEAAARQHHFWEMADALYRTQWMWQNAPAPRVVLIDRAKELGLNVPQFEEDLDASELRERVAADQARGQALGVKSTPWVFINGYSVPNAELNERGLRAAIQAALAKGG
jgi:protein-disulfide isomerase